MNSRRGVWLDLGYEQLLEITNDQQKRGATLLSATPRDVLAQRR